MTTRISAAGPSIRALSLFGAVLAAGIFITAPAFAGSQNLVTNGSFENTSAYYNYNGTSVGTEVNNSNLAGWSINGCGSSSTCGFQFIANSNLGSTGIYDQEDGHVTNFYSTPGASPDGGNAFVSDPQHEAEALVQNIANMTVGDTYTLTFYQASMQQQGYSGASQDTWAIGLGNGNNFNTQYGATMNNPSGGSTGWVKQTLTFVANATSNTLFFFATANSGSNPPFMLLDGVSLTDTTVPVPEPTTIAMFGAGLLGLVAIRRQRRRA